jgi:1-acyl-sn-glycerol-3-phosphate acyltransferase
MSALKTLIRVCCQVHDEQLARVPAQGPLVLVTNHINFLEVPLLYTFLLPRRMTGFAKVESWKDPLRRYLFNLAEIIPVHRGEADTNAFRLGLAALEAGDIVAVAPEGTRSRHGRLQRARAGAVLLALRSGAPLLPVVHHGGEKLQANLARLRRTDFYFAVGEPFHLDPGGAKVTRQVRQQMIDEVMFRMARLLPSAYRGEYADLAAATETYLR